MRRLFYLLLIMLLFVSTRGAAQEVSVQQDSLKFDLSLPSRTNTTATGTSNFIPLRLTRLNPMENLLPQFTPYQRFTLSPQPVGRNSWLPPIHWDGAASDFINSKSRTAIASMLPSPRLLLYSSATLGLVETPFFGKANYYVLNAGANYAVTSALNVGITGGYDSNFGSLPYWNAGMNAHYMISPDFAIDGGLTYVQTGQNMFNLNQSAVMIDLHGRYRLSDSWYANAYGGAPVLQRNNTPDAPMMPMMNTPYFGGTLEHWFNPTVGVEGGMMWIQDFTGKMRPRPKIELLFRPGRR